MRSMKALVRDRSVIKASLTKAAIYVAAMTENSALEDVEIRLEHLQRTWKKFEDSTIELNQYCEEEDFVDPSENFSEYEDSYLATCSKLRNLKSRLCQSANQGGNGSASPSSGIENLVAQQTQIIERMLSSGTSTNSNAFEQILSQQAQLLERLATNSAKQEDGLPKITLPKFSGSYKEWPSFKNLFESAVASNNSLSHIQKFYYLKSLLTDEAAKVIQHLPVTESAFQTAYSRLVDRFDRPKYIVNSFIDSFMAIPSTLVENSKVLRKISDEANEIIRGLYAINEEGRDCWLIYLLLAKVDPESRSRWIHDSKDNCNPNIIEFLDFLDARCEELEMCHQGKSKGINSIKVGNKCLVSMNDKSKCGHCNSPKHFIFSCPIFLELTTLERREFVKNNSLCYNCMREGHVSKNCSSKRLCKHCNSSHHSLLHFEQSHQNTSEEDPIANSQQSSAENSISNIACSVKGRNNQIQSLMPTAIILVENGNGQMIECRALLDSASQLSYITDKCFQKLNLPRVTSRILVSGISSIKAESTKGLCKAFIKSRYSDDNLQAELHILSKITSNLPASSFSMDVMKFKHFNLADPTCNKSSAIDILLGLDLIWNVFTYDKCVDQFGNITAVSTIFGWVVTSVNMMENDACTKSMVTVVDIDRTLREFWEIEEPESKTSINFEDEFPEAHFKSTHSRDSNGKYIVQLPFKKEDPRFGNTLSGALCRFKAVERRLQKNKSLRDKYVAFMREYESLGHMVQITSDDILINGGKVFYLPHHPVLGEKIRVVFDGSFRDSNGVSLNDMLHIGPKIQRDLFAVCLRFRFHRYVFAADIVKMFRQIWVAEQHQNYQRILWRESPSERLKHYKLVTVTYGTASAPFLSIRVLQQLAEDYKLIFPLASQVLIDDFYVDDVLTGAESEEELLTVKENLVKLLNEAGLELRKWISNSSTLSSSNENVSFYKSPSEDIKKVLGIYWQPVEDILAYNISLQGITEATKRHVLSDVSRIFDPLGLLAPVVVRFKILLREIWSSNLEWDEPLPTMIANTWQDYRIDLQRLTDLTIKRYIENSKAMLELHGFCDASNYAYSAAIYCRFENDDGEIFISLIAAKTRVAPIKQKSLPRLELCGALLLARLFKRVNKSFTHNQPTGIRAWCDSTIVLSWLSQSPIKLKTFEANRTSEILDILPYNLWSHVASKDNPADCASRGMSVAKLVEFDLWWNGPEWLASSEKYKLVLEDSNNFNRTTDLNAICGQNKCYVAITIKDDDPLGEAIQRFSNWRKLVRIVAYIIKFFNRTHRKIRTPTSLTFDEILKAKFVLFKYAQEEFKDEIHRLQNGKILSTRSKLLKLNPYIDNHGVLRVGGRLRNAQLDESIQHPIIFGKNSRITQLVLEDLHEKHLHPGVSALFIIVRQSFWIFGARNLIKSITFKCLKCFRYRQHETSQFMADLPKVRARQAYPFENTGCDYAGPFTLKQFSGRNPRKSKGYICLFVCLVTSALHLELVTDYTTESFLAALKRFISRRGYCRQIFTDNGKNFVGASRELREMQNVIISQTKNATIVSSLAQDGIKWTFIPPLAPHWGGMWESGVRSVKLHLRRVVKTTVLTFEQMHTLLAQIEAVINSRPLGYVPDSECDYLSPGHFLIGRPYTLVPEGELTATNPNRLSYWQHVQNMVQGFWKRWHQEYLTSLQNRPKWNIQRQNISNGDIVILKERNAPPAKWVLGKIIDAFEGTDGIVRVVKVKTQVGEVTRSITSIIKLPIC